MTELFSISIADEIVEVRRELVMRRKVYPRRVAQGDITPQRAARQIAVLEPVLERLKQVAAQGGMT